MMHAQSPDVMERAIAALRNTWLVVIFDDPLPVGLMVTGRPYGLPENDRAVGAAFARYHSKAPDAKVGHVVLCLHTDDQCGRALRVGPGADPTTAELSDALRAARSPRFVVAVSGDFRLAESHHEPPWVAAVMAVVRSVGQHLSDDEISSRGVIASPEADEPADEADEPADEAAEPANEAAEPANEAAEPAAAEPAEFEPAEFEPARREALNSLIGAVARHLEDATAGAIGSDAVGRSLAKISGLASEIGALVLPLGYITAASAFAVVMIEAKAAFDANRHADNASANEFIEARSSAANAFGIASNALASALARRSGPE